MSGIVSARWATVLFVLDEHVRTTTHEAGENELLAAVGPDFSADVSLLRWT